MNDNLPGNDLVRLDNQLCFALYAASRKITALYEPLLTRHGITYTQYITLMVLWEHGSLTVKQIGEKLLLDSGTLTPVLKKLEEKGHVTRERQKDDERVVLVRVTEKGMAVRDDALAFLPGMLCNTGLEPEKLVKLRDEVRELMEKLG